MVEENSEEIEAELEGGEKEIGLFGMDLGKKGMASTGIVVA